MIGGDHLPESYSSLYNSMGTNNDHYVESRNIEYDMGSLVTDLPEADDFTFPSMSTNFFYPVHLGDMPYAQDALCFPPGNCSIGQRQQISQQLHIDTQLSSYPINDPESSIESSISLPVALQTPYLSLHPSFQPPVQIFSPQSASAERRIFIPDSGNKSPFPASPLSHNSSSCDGDMSDAPISPLPIEPDVMTRVPMPHILEWKKVIEQCGTNDFIPQTVYQPYTEADRKRYIRDVELRETIFFHSNDSPGLGISLDDALKQRLRHLKDKNDSMFTGCGPSVSIRIQWPGYAPWSKQIPTMDFKTPKGPITRAKLAKNIATCIRRFAVVVENKPMEAESDIRWKIGKQYIRVEDLILVSLHHVSKGSWQPQLRLRTLPTTFSYQWDESLP